MENHDHYKRKRRFGLASLDNESQKKYIRNVSPMQKNIERSISKFSITRAIVL